MSGILLYNKIVDGSDGGLAKLLTKGFLSPKALLLTLARILAHSRDIYVSLNVLEHIPTPDDKSTVRL
jgi:hypothetical protein